jgi:hypothetical protein
MYNEKRKEAFYRWREKNREHYLEYCKAKQHENYQKNKDKIKAANLRKRVWLQLCAIDV